MSHAADPEAAPVFFPISFSFFSRLGNPTRLRLITRRTLLLRYYDWLRLQQRRQLQLSHCQMVTDHEILTFRYARTRHRSVALYDFIRSLYLYLSFSCLPLSPSITLLVFPFSAATFCVIILARLTFMMCVPMPHSEPKSEPDSDPTPHSQI